MISVAFIVALNNAVCYTALASCSLHALHAGIYTSPTTKLFLFALAVGFWASTVNIDQVLLPGYIYIMIANIFFALLVIAFSVYEAKRSGYLTYWYESLQMVLHTGGEQYARFKK